MNETQCPPPGSPNEAWDKCIRSSSWIISFGTIIGAAGTVLLAATAPLLVGTGLGVAVSVNRCRNLLREQNKRDRECEAIGKGGHYGPYYGENKDKYESRDEKESEVTPKSDEEGAESSRAKRSEDYYDDEGMASKDEERIRKECCPVEDKEAAPPQHGQGDECICPPGTEEVRPEDKPKYCVPKEELKCTCPPPPPPPIICTCPPPSSNVCTCPSPSGVNKLNEQKMEGGKAEPCANKLGFSWPPLLTFSQVKTSEVPHNLDEEPFCTCDE